MPFRRSRALIVAILAGVLGLIVWPGFAGFYSSLLWYQQLGYGGVFTTSITTKFWLGLVAGLIAGIILFINLKFAMRLAPNVPAPVGYFEIEGERVPAPNIARIVTKFAVPIAFVVGLLLAFSGAGAWELYLRFRHQTPFGQSDALYGRDIAFYVFTLPFLERLAEWLFTLGLVTLFAIGLVYVTRGIESFGERRLRMSIANGARRHLFVVVAALFGVLAFEKYLDLSNIVLSHNGPVAGATYTDIHARLPIARVQIAIALLAALIAIGCAIGLKTRFFWIGLGLYLAVIVAGIVIPSILQRVSVLPNELAKETPYIIRNIAATRAGFALDRIEERELSGDIVLSAKDIKENRATINNIRLWDQKQLLETFAQIQEIRTYYEFVSVDNDRYTINGNLQQAMLSARELSAASLPNRNWINERLAFTHGYGLAFGPVDDITAEGMPVLFVKDIPPKSSIDSLQITRPEIYFGELTTEHVYVRTRAKEFDYPSGEQNVFATYEGNGGVGIGSFWRRMLFATRFGDMKLLLSEDMTDESRVLYHRNIRERLSLVAPFLTFDTDPYLVVAGGKLYWIADAYTTTDHYPYSQPAATGINYIRNSVKAVIDAYHGDVKLYIADESDPLIKTYSRIFPGILKPLSEMPQELRAHLRYPEDIFRVQTATYSTYHMDDPQALYNKEDQWSVAAMGESAEGSEQQSQMLDPYYTIMRLPGEQAEEFILMLPFTPRRKDNLASWMVARSDGDHYGKLAAYRFPKQSLVYGPRQVVTRINQEPEISRQLSLWNQRGSRVILGTLLVIPVGQGLLYVQPLYLQAESGKIPELRRVIVATDNRIVMEPTLEASINRLFGDGSSPEQPKAPVDPSQTLAATTAPPVRAPDATSQGKQTEDVLQTIDRIDQELKRLRRQLEQSTKKP